MISVFKDLNQFAKRWKTLDLAAIFCAIILPYFLVIFLLAYCIVQKNIYLFFYAVLSALLARLLNEVIYFFYKEKRPAYVSGTNVLIPIPSNYSFPSSHASIFFAMSWFLLFNNFYLGLVFLILSLIIGLARVFCGVHWFHDIIAGGFVGLISALVVNYLMVLVR